jgi:membrane-associated phospholipid phosphatase
MSHFSNRSWPMITLAAILFCSGCATNRADNGWGQNSPFQVGWERTAAAALKAAKSPAVWAPLASAAALRIDNADQRLSNWAVDHTPVFGSTDGASRASDVLCVVAGAGLLASWYAIPADDWNAKLKVGEVELGAIASTALVTEGLKYGTHRERPNGDDNSFPSGHTALASAADTMTIRNLQTTSLGTGARTALTVGADALTIATAWSRVEAGEHYPTDVLVAAAIGNSFGQMFNDAFLDDELSQRLGVSFEPVGRGGVFTWNWRF